ncbi:apolipoprotein N-acyltransferase [Microcoleus sp. FACHB-1515]|nr:apolipoprotein N-acyltransferase [Microcoleus sp. FACHB-1515]
MGLTVAPVNAWFLGWIALAPLWFLLQQDRSIRSRLLLAGLWGMGYHGTAIVWILGLHPLTWMGVPWLASVAIALFCWVFIACWGALLVMSWAIALHFLTRKSGSIERVLIGTALWCALEAIWSSGALWWTSLSLTQSPHDLVILHLGQISGPTAVVAAIVAVNGLLAEGAIAIPQLDRARKYFATALVLLVGLHLIGFALYSRPIARLPEAAINIGIVQGNIPTREKLFDNGIRRALTAYTEGYRSLTKVKNPVDAVLTPEGALPWLWIDSPQQNLLYQAILDRNIPAWIGTAGSVPDGLTWSLFTVLGNGEIAGRYDKVKLVPLGEYIPFRSILGGFINRLSPLEASMIHGAPNQQFATPFGRAIGGICFDSAFASLFRNQAANGGEFILTASNNDPYNDAMKLQHEAQDIMRSIETDRWAARATNTGFSGIVDPHGRIEWRSPSNVYTVHAHTIYRRLTQTLYVRWGDWLLIVLLIGSAIAISYEAIASRNS